MNNLLVLNNVITREYNPRKVSKKLVIDALDDLNLQRGKYSFVCVSKNDLSRTYCMPTSKGSAVTVVITNPLNLDSSRILISGPSDACRWHEGNLEELAEIKEQSDLKKFPGVQYA